MFHLIRKIHQPSGTRGWRDLIAGRRPIRLINFVHKLQGIDKVVPMILRMREHMDLHVLTVVCIERSSLQEANALMAKVLVETSDEVAVFGNSMMGQEIALQAKAKRTLIASDFAPEFVLRTGQMPNLPRVLLRRAVHADGMLTIYNGPTKNVGRHLAEAVRRGNGRVIGYLKSIHDQGLGLTALKHSAVKAPLKDSTLERLDDLLLPMEEFRVFLDGRPMRTTITGYPPFYSEWRRFIEQLPECQAYRREKRSLEVVLFTRGPATHKPPENQVIDDPTVVKLVDDIYDACRRTGREFRLRIKPHPYQRLDPLRAWAEGKLEVRFVAEPPAYLAATSDIVVATYSSTILDGLVFRKPMIEYFVENEAFRRLHPDGSPFGEFGVAIARTREEFESAFAEALSPNVAPDQARWLEASDRDAEALAELFVSRSGRAKAEHA